MPRLVRRQSAFTVDPSTLDRYANDTAGEKRMWMDCLKEADRSVRGNATATTRTVRQRAMEDARSWFLSARIDAGSFLWVCQVLEMEPGKVREGLGKRL